MNEQPNTEVVTDASSLPPADTEVVADTLTPDVPSDSATIDTSDDTPETPEGLSDQEIDEEPQDTDPTDDKPETVLEMPPPSSEELSELLGDDFNSDVGFPYNLTGKSLNDKMLGILAERDLTDEEKTEFKETLLNRMSEIYKKRDGVGSEGLELLKKFMDPMLDTNLEMTMKISREQRELQKQQQEDIEKGAATLRQKLGDAHLQELNTMIVKEIGAQGPEFSAFIQDPNRYFNSDKLFEAFNTGGDELVSLMRDAVEAFKVKSERALNYINGLTEDQVQEAAFATDVYKLVNNPHFPKWDKDQMSIQDYLSLPVKFGVTPKQIASLPTFKGKYV